jgi:Cd2+/Zn2+-exporting ATPase
MASELPMASAGPVLRISSARPSEDDGNAGRTSRALGQETWWERWHLLALALSTWIFLISAVIADHATQAPSDLVLLLYICSYLSGGIAPAVQALSDLRHGRVNVDLLMVIAALGAAAVNAWGEGAVLLALFSTSNALEHAALERTRHAIKSLMDLSPESAIVLREGVEQLLHVDDLLIGDRVLVRPGERIPVDGVVVDGHSTVNQSAITGESVPVDKSVGDQVYAATINDRGVLTIDVTKQAQETTLAKIIRFVEDARLQKSTTQRFADKFEGRYAVGVIVVSAIVFLLLWLGLGHDAGDSFYRAMTLLVVASPCALVISTPASTLAGLANAARNGILFKGGNHLEQLSTVKAFAFDKTGTLTTGHQNVTDIVSIGNLWTEQSLLAYAAAVERFSEHHLSYAIIRAARDQGIGLSDVTGFEAIAGKGVFASVNAHHIWIGNKAMAQAESVDFTDALPITDALQRQGKSAVMVGDDTGVHGVIAVADAVRSEAKPVVQKLREEGVTRILILTGDNQRVADATGTVVDIQDVRADLLPEEKLAVIRELASEGPVAMVGDGVNDAPALAIATLGVAMGGGGTDVALETADVVLMNNTLEKLPYALALSRRTRKTIRQNLTISLSVIVVLVSCALTIGIPLPVGVIGHEGSTVIVVLNGLRLLRTQQ